MSGRERVDIVGEVHGHRQTLTFSTSVDHNDPRASQTTKVLRSILYFPDFEAYR